jgi:hypothetical protein
MILEKSLSLSLSCSASSSLFRAAAAGFFTIEERESEKTVKVLKMILTLCCMELLLLLCFSPMMVMMIMLNERECKELHRVERLRAIRCLTWPLQDYFEHRARLISREILINSEKSVEKWNSLKVSAAADSRDLSCALESVLRSDFGAMQKSCKQCYWSNGIRQRAVVVVAATTTTMTGGAGEREVFLSHKRII